MKKLLLFVFIPYLVFAQSTREEKGSPNCDPKKNSNYAALINQRFVTVEDKNIKEITSGLSSLSIQKRTVSTKENKESFLHFKIYTFLTQNSSRYVVYENSLTMDEAKAFLVDLVNMEEEFRKKESDVKMGFYSSFNNTTYFIRTGYELSQQKDKTPSGQIKRDKNGDELLKAEKNWFIDVDTSCGDSKTYYKITDILQFIEIVRNTINS